MLEVANTIKGTLSFRGWRRRTVRVMVTSAGYWLGLTSISAGVGWGAFFDVIALPVPVLGWVIAVFGAGSSSGLENPKK